MEFVGLFYFFVLTFIFFIVAGLCTPYVIIGLRQMSLGKSENSEIKKKAGFKTLVISSSILLAVLILYVVLIFG